ncbi:MAG: response regulator [Spirochaetota bacterium]|jgi:signal transduction histidine kinase/CheY-like chemotaxis protein/HAMP domain-containing protein|nr:response regulator [Spirochaetota bacterium]
MNWLRNMKMRNKLFLAFGSLIVIMITLSTITMSQFVKISNEYTILINSTLQRYMYLTDANNVMLQMRFHNLSRFYLMENGIYSRELSQIYDDLDLLINSFYKYMNNYRDTVMGNNFLSQSDKQWRMEQYDAIMARFNSDFAVFSRNVRVAVANNDAVWLGRIIPEGIQGANAISDRLTALSTLATSTVQEKMDMVAQHYVEAVETVLIFTLLTIILAAVMSFVISNTIREPILKMQRAMAEIAKGNMGYTIRSPHRDELGTLANNIGDMIDAVAEMNKTSAVMDYMDAMITITDSEKNLVFINKLAAIAHGVDQKDCLNKKCYKVLKRLDRPCIYCVSPQVWPDKEDEEIKEVGYSWDDRLEKWLTGKSAIIRWVDGSLVLFHSFIDATMKKNYEENLNKAKLAAEAASASKTAFLSNMSHEIRTPMNAIIGMTDLLAHENLTQRQEAYVKDITLSAHSLLGLINDILDLSKIEAGKLSLNPVDYDFLALMDNVSSMFTFVAQKKGLDFQYETSGDLPDYLFGDDIRLRQILTNICSNAIKYTEKGHVKMKLTVGEDDLIFEISDTGMGIRKEDLPKLFNTFERVNTNKTRDIVGTGLGLSICKSFVEMMSGTLLVDSEYEQGSVFTIIIPKVIGKKSGVKFKKTASTEHVLRAPEANILVVDDNEFNLRVAVGLMGLFDINIKTAMSGQESIDMVQKEDFDIVFMDHMMPGMDGVEATAKIRELGGRHATFPIIALTANAVQGMREMFLANGFNEFVAKPIDLSEMEAVLLEWLPEKKVRTNAIEKYEKKTIETQDDFIAALDGISDIDTGLGLSRVSGMKDMYRKTFEFFYAKLTSECDGMADKLEAQDLNAFMISIHAMKSSLAILGIMRLSESAAKLEASAREGDMQYCVERYPDLQEKLFNLFKKLIPIFEVPTKRVSKKPGEASLLRDALRKTMAAVDNFDQIEGTRILNDLLVYDFGEPNNDLLTKASTAFNNFEYDDVKQILEKLNV